MISEYYKAGIKLARTHAHETKEPSATMSIIFCVMYVNSSLSICPFVCGWVMNEAERNKTCVFGVVRAHGEQWFCVVKFLYTNIFRHKYRGPYRI